MAIGVVGNYNSVRPSGPAPLPQLPAGGATAVPYQTDIFAPTAAVPQAQAMAYPPAQTYPQTYPQAQAVPLPGVAPQSSGFNFGRLGAIGLGALGAFRFILPRLGSPAGWVSLAVIAGGGLVGNIVWNKLAKDVAPDKAGGIGHVATIAGGAAGAFFLGMRVFGSNPAGLLVGGLIAGGAFLGHKLYAMMARP